ncbi:MAG: HipA domain-containing protein [Proteobacteria bacterium]|nr:HipA domain-containing protein [Pseudomonadota bacterium]
MSARCPLTYDLLTPEETRYSMRGMRLLAKGLTHLEDFPYTQAEQQEEARTLAGKLSIQGVQPKMSATLEIALGRGTFKPTEKGGRFIIKMQSSWPHLPENEDLTMRLASLSGIEVPKHGLIFCKDNTLSFWIARFDRPSTRTKLPLEDFAQLSQHTRQTKYDASMEQVVRIIDTFATFPMLEKEKLLRLTLFNFLVGNEDMHLKNFSLLREGDLVKLSPAYDLVNTTLALGRAAREELALPLLGKKNKLTSQDFLGYFAKERLGLTAARIDHITGHLKKSISTWDALLEASFLPEKEITNYKKITEYRLSILFDN